MSWLFLREALRYTAVGLVIGLGGAIAGGTVLQSALVGVRANHPLALIGVCLFLGAVAVAAALLPARRAARLDPIAALRRRVVAVVGLAANNWWDIPYALVGHSARLLVGWRAGIGNTPLRWCGHLQRRNRHDPSSLGDLYRVTVRG